MNISVIGLGKLGLPTAACFASRGNKVYGWDNNKEFMEELWKGNCPIKEPFLEDFIEDSGDRLVFTQSIDEAIRKSDITLIIVPTPSLDEGGFDNSYVVQVLELITPILREKIEHDKFHIIDVVSTVMPGSCDKEFIPFLEGRTGGKCGKDFGLVYNPEFIALGSVIKDFMNPDMVLIGESDSISGGEIEKLYRSLNPPSNLPPFCKISLINAEISKLALNYYVTMKVSYANFLSLAICNMIPGADVDEVTSAIGYDKRIGHKYLKGGFGFGGPCFPRDVWAMSKLAHNRKTMSLFSQHEINGIILSWIEQVIIDRKIKKATILGMSYKPGTHVIEESQSEYLAKKLIADGIDVKWHDDFVPQSAIPDIPRGATMWDALEGAEVVIMTLPIDYEWEMIDKAVSKNALIIDCWRMAKGYQWKRADYKPIGIG